MMSNEQAQLDITSAISKYVDVIYIELKERWNSWRIDLTKKEVHQVVGGIMSRQVAVMTNFASSPNFWNGDMAPAILRVLADNYINLAWILKDPEDRAGKFIKYGLGQAKLNLEHRKAQMEKDGMNAKDDILMQASERWINAQRLTFWTEVNLGSWSEMSTRKMAEEADCIDFYNYVYQPFSAATHSTWDHISRYNLEYSDNPLHMFLLKPKVTRFNPELEYLELGAKYLSKMFWLFDSTFNHKATIESSFSQLQNEITRIEQELNDTRKDQGI